MIISGIACICKPPTLSIWSMGSRSGTQRWKHTLGLDAANSLYSLRKCRCSIGSVTSEVCFCVIPNSLWDEFLEITHSETENKGRVNPGSTVHADTPFIVYPPLFVPTAMFFLPDRVLLIGKRSVVSSIAAAAWLHYCFVLNEDMLVECFTEERKGWKINPWMKKMGFLIVWSTYRDHCHWHISSICDVCGRWAF